MIKCASLEKICQACLRPQLPHLNCLLIIIIRCVDDISKKDKNRQQGLQSHLGKSAQMQCKKIFRFKTGGSGFMITGAARYKPNIWWATLTGHFSNNIKVIIAQMGAAAEMFAAQLYRERRR